MKKDILRKILEIEKEQKQRFKKNTLLRYNAGQVVHQKQMEFHKRKERNRWVFGGNRSGKTECGAVEAIWMARGIHPFRKNRKKVFGWIVSLTYEVQRDVAQAKILYYLNPDWIHKIVMREGSSSAPETGIIDAIYIKNVFGEISKLGFKSCDQGRAKFQGAALDFVWFDEEPPFEIYEECKMRILDKKGDIFGTMTPLMGLTWVYYEIYLNNKDDINVFYLTMEWADNPFLHKSEVEQMTKTLSQDSLDSRRYGHFRQNTGLVYPEFDENVHVIEPFDLPSDWQSGISIDPGLKNPLSCHFYCRDYDNNVYVIAEHYEKDKDIDYHAAAILKIADRLSWKRAQNGMLEALIDSAAGQRTLASSRSVAELFHERGILVNTNVKKDLFSGIQTVKSYFSANRIFIFKSCVNLIRELKSYWWGDDDCPKKTNDHALDELRYYIMSKSQPPRSAIVKSKHLRYKDKLLIDIMNQKKRR